MNMKKVLSVIFALAIIFTMLPVQSFAANSGFTYEPPAESFLKGALKKSSGSVNIEMNKKGKWSVSDMYALEAAEMSAYVSEMLSEKYYNEIKDSAEEMGIKSYAEYKKYILEMLGDDYSAKKTEPALYFSIDCYEKNDFGYTREEMFLRGAGYVLSLPKNDSKLMKKISDALENGKSYYCECRIEAAGKDVLHVQGGFTDAASYAANNTKNMVMIDENISLSGKQGIVLGNAFIPADTKKLCISSRTNSTVNMLWGDVIPEDCVIAAAPDEDDRYRNDGEVVYDLAEIAKSLPELRELHILQGVLKNTAKLDNFTKLEALSYYPITFEDDYIKAVKNKPFTKMKSLKKLRLYPDYSNYDFLAEMDWLEEVFVETSGGNSKKLQKIFSCPYITGLKLDDVKSLEGIEKLTNLKDLEIDSDDVSDFAPLGKLKNLESLYVMSRGTAKNIDAITSLKKLKSLTLHSMDDEDLSFVGKMTSLKELNFYYVNSSFTKSIGKLTGLKRLSLNAVDTGGGYGTGRLYDTSFLSKLTNLESIHFFSNRIDITGISKLKKLKSVSIWLSEFSDLSELKNCKALEELVIYNNDSAFDANWISGSNIKDLRISDGSDGGIKNIEKLAALKKMNYLLLDFTGVSESTVKKIKKALPKCKIEVYELSYSESKIY